MMARWLLEQASLIALLLSIAEAHFSSPGRVIYVSSYWRKHNKNSRLFCSTSAVAAASGKTISKPENMFYRTTKYRDIPFGPKKVLDGISQIVKNTAVSAGVGLGVGGFLGGMRGVPNLMGSNVGLLGTPLVTEIRLRFIRWGSKTGRWAFLWGSTLGVFTCLDTLLLVIRNGRQDPFNLVVSAISAGAFVARSKGTKVMGIYAVAYGAAMYAASHYLADRIPEESQTPPQRDPSNIQAERVIRALSTEPTSEQEEDDDDNDDDDLGDLGVDEEEDDKFL